MTFVGVNCALNFDDKRNLPPWLEDAQKLAEPDGGVRLATSWHNGSAPQGGSNTLPILIGPLPQDARGSHDLWGYGWNYKSKCYACCAPRLHADRV